MLFGIAALRAKVLPKWPAVLLIPSSPTLTLSPAMPLIARTIGSFVFGVAVAWLGWALLSEKPPARGSAVEKA